jgi:excisionase family DNA binding protein
MIKLLTAEETSKLLRIPKRSVYEFAKQGLIPSAFRIGKHWRFREDAIESWIVEQAGSKPINSRK